MASLNKVQIIGYVGADPEMRMIPSGESVTDFRVAVSENYGDNDHTEWFSVVAWKKLAEICNQQVYKGQQVYVEGRLKTKSWEQDGIKRYKTDLVASSVIFLTWKDKDVETTPTKEEYGGLFD